MTFFVFRTRGVEGEPCPGARRVDLPVKEWWSIGAHPLSGAVLNRKTLRHDGHLQLWAIDVASLDDLLSIMALNGKRNQEIVIGSTCIDGQQQRYIEIYDDDRE